MNNPKKLPQPGSFFCGFLFGELSIFAEMNVKEFLSSGIIETYCLGFTSPEENQLVENMLALHPEVQAEIDAVGNSLNDVLKRNEIKPAASVKTAVMHAVYEHQAGIDHCFVPLLDKVSNFGTVLASALANNLQSPAFDFENLHVQELPSTPEILNMAVWVKEGHEPETHIDCTEFIAIIEGSCEMLIRDSKTMYVAGDIISIPTHVPHQAIITSKEPMFALVQRQLIAV